jgi:2-oxoglutarate dehydrogenase E1 component
VPTNSGHQLPDDFGGNEWLVDELFEQYLKDKNSVDKKWWSIFESMESERGGSASVQSAPAPKAAAEAPAPKRAQAKPAAAPSPSKPVTTPAQAHVPEGIRAAQAEDNAARLAEGSSAAPAATSSAQENGASDVVANAPAVTPAEPTKASRPAEPPKPIPAQLPKSEKVESTEEEKLTPLRGPAKAIATNMDASLSVPTATTVRAVPAKLLIDNRVVINNHLKRARGGKISFTHILGFAIVKAVKAMPSMNVSYDIRDGKPVAVQPAHVNFGLAIDLPRPDGSRLLVVPNIKKAETLNFAEFWHAYDDLVKRGRSGKLGADDYAGTTISLTNPGGIGTVHSVPRLSKGQAAIIGAGALEYPAEYQGASEKTLARLAISKVMTLTSTYDHRVIQGAGSGEFLKLIHGYLLGEDGFYDEIFEALRIPYEPVRWSADIQVDPDDEINKVARIQQLIHAYRVRGHLMADVNPLEYVQRRHPDLDVQTHGLTLWDLDREWPTGGFGGKPMLPFRAILGVLRDAYCRTTGFEYMHLQDPEQRKWFQDELEHPYSKPSREEQLRILSKLNAAEAFETFLQTKFVGQKRFSLEGGESLIPLLDALASHAADDGMDEVTIGMAHRGRLNALTNIAGKTYAQVFREFEGRQDPNSVQGSGDVKYHLGSSGTYTSDSGNETKVYLAANPSHLEVVNPVLEGITRAKQDELNAPENSFPVLPVLVHGDAAFAGQGVVMETLQLSQLKGYKTGGTIHVIVNNQIGFTTAPSSSRSSVYSTDVAKTVQAPIFHVNGDDPEAVVRAADLAFRYRQKFNKDVVIDMVCYRRRGHNEGDDPSMTQPLMYNLIEAKRSVRKLYTESLLGRGDISQDEVEQALRDYQERLEKVFAETHAAQTEALPVISPEAARSSDDALDDVDTAISPDTLEHIGDAHLNYPEGFTVHNKLKQVLEKRAQMAREGGIDWGFAEMAAFGSLTMEGIHVRVAGQDSRRGTFVQRHAVIHDRANGNEWYPLENLTENAADFEIYDSLLSEYAALGFEFGYSVQRPESLVVWEAQFGDFVNGAQMIIDEYLSSSEQKWGMRSKVVLMLPHGYEGQGPDHSSGRIERFLQLAAENNLTIANPSTGANHFHLLRRQAKSKTVKPLVIFTPKQLLRLKAAATNVKDFTEGSFQPVIPDAQAEASKVTRVMLVSGRLYYDLAAQRQKAGDETVAIVRVEQLYPLPLESIKAELAKYPDADVVWVQDEPENQGPWPFMALNLAPQLDADLTVISRPASASTAAGSMKRHTAEQQVLLERAFQQG